jgi:hypothetical protein
MLTWLFRLRCRLADPAPMPVWLTRLGCPVGWFFSVARLDCSAPPPYLLVRSEFPARCFFSAARVVGSAPPTSALARSGFPPGWIGSAGRLPGTSTMTQWLPRFRCPRLAGSAVLPATGRLGCAARLPNLTRKLGWLDSLPCPLVLSHQLRSLKHYFPERRTTRSYLQRVFLPEHWTPLNRVLGQRGQETEKAAVERLLYRSPHKQASRAGRAVF